MDRNGSGCNILFELGDSLDVAGFSLYDICVYALFSFTTADQNTSGGQLA
jgi:hypothetical protein